MRGYFAPWLFLLLLVACSDPIEPGNRPGDPIAVTGLPLAPVEVETLSQAPSLPGTLQRGTRTTLVARSDGRVSGFAVNEGEAVAAGQTLLTLADNQAEARLRAARSGFEAARAREQEALARHDLAERTFARYAQLRRGEAVTPQEFDQVDTERKAAGQALAQARAQLRIAEADLAGARIVQGFTRVTAPFAATVVRKESRNGATVLPGTALVTLDRRDGWEALTQVPESLWPGLALGQEVRVEVPALALRLPGTVSERLPGGDSGSRAFPVKIALPADDRFETGLFVRIQLPGAATEVLTVPATALVERGQLTGVYLARGGELHYRLVKTGRHLGERVEVLSGLAPGDRIVTAETARARDGARLQE